MKPILNRFMKCAALVVASQSIFPSFYRYVGAGSAKMNVLGMLAVVMCAAALLTIFIHPYTSLFAVSMILSAVPYVIVASVFDPFVAWIRGETEKPMAMMGHNLLMHLWPVVSVTLTATIIGLLMLLGSKIANFDGSVTDTAGSVSYLLFVAMIGIHQFFAVQKFPNVRVSQKYVTGVVFVFLFLYQPVSKLWS